MGLAERLQGLCVALFAECVLPLFWSTHSRYLKRLFFLNARHIDMTPTFIFLAQLVTAAPNEISERCIRLPLPRSPHRPDGAISHKTANLTTIDPPRTAASST